MVILKKKPISTEKAVKIMANDIVDMKRAVLDLREDIKRLEGMIMSNHQAIEYVERKADRAML
jgi:hypothetical protein